MLNTSSGFRVPAMPGTTRPGAAAAAHDGIFTFG